MGPQTLFNLGACEGGMSAFCERYADSFHRLWDDLGTPHLAAAIGAIIEDGLSEAADGKTVTDMAAERDALINAHLKAVKSLRGG